MAGLTEVLVAAQDRGLLGPGPVANHISHAEGFSLGWSAPPSLVLDLGSGAGVPGLALALAHPGLEVVLVDGRSRAVDWLREAVARLDLESRVTVLQARAETLGRDEVWRATVPMVVARGFGAPAVVAECAAPLLTPGGVLVVSEPPEVDPTRWPVEPLATLGLVATETWHTSAGHYQRLEQQGPCPPRYPRRVGIPSKRPLW